MKTNIFFIMNKRTFLKTGIAFGAGIIAAPAFAGKDILGKASGSSSSGFVQIKLPYSFSALEPYIDALTMELHYSRHHAGYTANFNKAAVAEGIANKSLKDIFASVSSYSASVRNNGGGFYNHNLFWESMSPAGGGTPKGSLKNSIDSSFGSFDAFKDQFAKAASSVFGSGWAWLILQDGKLKITTTPNQDNPLMDVVSEKGKPILALDVWEHAYYLNYQNRRGDYIGAFWNVADWESAEKRMTG